MEESQNEKQKMENYLKIKFPRRKDLSLEKMERMPVGYSYETWLLKLTWSEAGKTLSESLVLRREPVFGIVPPYDVRPQFEVMQKVHEKGIPVPKVLWLEMDREVFARPFFVMEMVQAENLDNYFPAHPEEQDSLRRQYAETIARIHALDYEALGFCHLSTPEHGRQYAEKEIARWEKVVKDNQYTPQPLMSELFSWLKRNIPQSERTTLCHCDLKVGIAGNFLARDGRITALLDWEMASIGDSARDLGYVCLNMRFGTFWNTEDFLRTYEGLAGVTVNRQSVFFWEVFSFVMLAAMGYPGMKTGLTSADFNVQALAANYTYLPWMKDTPAKMLGF